MLENGSLISKCNYANHHTHEKVEIVLHQHVKFADNISVYMIPKAVYYKKEFTVSFESIDSNCNVCLSTEVPSRVKTQTCHEQDTRGRWSLPFRLCQEEDGAICIVSNHFI